MILQQRQEHKGFTLIELIISITIFTFFISVGVASYLNLSITLKKENVQRQLYSEMETVLADINRWGKFYGIDYQWYDNAYQTISPKDGNEELVLISKDKSSRITLKKMADADSLGLYQEVLRDGVYEPAEGFEANIFETVTSNNLHIQDVRFYLFPIRNSDAFQQKITVVLHGYMVSPYKEGKEEFTLQTSMSSRLYASNY